MSGNQARILVVDDEPAIRRFLHVSLTAHGYLVLEADNGQAALAAARQGIDALKEAISAKIPASRMGYPKEIAAAVVYLASEEAAYVTGQTVHVNGGLAMV